MDHRPVSGSSWKLTGRHAADAQGLVVSGFGDLPTGRALMLEFRWTGSGNGRWLDALQAVAPVTSANGREERAVALAFTHSGLARMGLPEVSLDSFATPFREGMMQEDRLRRLGDRGKDGWSATVIEAGPHWSGNTRAAGQIDPPPPTPKTVHALLMLYDKDEDSAEAWAAQVETVLAGFEIAIVHHLPLELRNDAAGIAREHFGFADGMSQPVPFDAVAVQPPGQDRAHGIPLGDILLGFTNSHHEIAPSPIAPVAQITTPDDAPDTGLRPHPLADGMLDLGLDGSYMVVRELRQDVAAFWNALDEGAAHIRRRDPHGSAHVTADWLAERVVGRTRDGALLCPASTLKEELGNDFGFFDRDRHGHGCPVGSHVRRSNPRDGLAPTPDQKETLLKAANNHRILRRGRKYGTTIADDRRDDEQDRGLLFVCLNTDIVRQFEFVQQTWLLNPNFATLYDETDPLLGPAGKMTARDGALRRRVAVNTFVRLAGGDYFFLPSLPALRYLAAL